MAPKKKKKASSDGREKPECVPLDDLEAGDVYWGYNEDAICDASIEPVGMYAIIANRGGRKFAVACENAVPYSRYDVEKPVIKGAGAKITKDGYQSVTVLPDPAWLYADKGDALRAWLIDADRHIEDDHQEKLDIRNRVAEELRENFSSD
jgi:hypothetical protein